MSAAAVREAVEDLHAVMAKSLGLLDAVSVRVVADLVEEGAEGRHNATGARVGIPRHEIVRLLAELERIAPGVGASYLETRRANEGGTKPSAPSFRRVAPSGAYEVRLDEILIGYVQEWTDVEPGDRWQAIRPNDQGAVTVGYARTRGAAARLLLPTKKES